MLTFVFLFSFASNFDCRSSFIILLFFYLKKSYFLIEDLSPECLSFVCGFTRGGKEMNNLKKTKEKIPQLEQTTRETIHPSGRWCCCWMSNVCYVYCVWIISSWSKDNQGGRGFWHFSFFFLHTRIKHATETPIERCCRRTTWSVSF